MTLISAEVISVPWVPEDLQLQCFLTGRGIRPVSRSLAPAASSAHRARGSLVPRVLFQCWIDRIDKLSFFPFSQCNISAMEVKADFHSLLENKHNLKKKSNPHDQKRNTHHTYWWSLNQQAKLIKFGFIILLSFKTTNLYKSVYKGLTWNIVYI